MLPPPPGWKSDELTKFIDTAQQNIFATFHNKKAIYKALSRIDAALHKIATNLTNPSDILTPQLLMRSHSAFRASCIMSMSGQVVDAYPLIRSCLEYAGYAQLIHQDYDVARTWLNRHADEKSTAKVRNTFTQTNIKDALSRRDQSLCKTYDHLYQRTIDFGAHPNERSVTGALTIRESADQNELEQAYLVGDSLAIDHALKTAAQAGLCTLMMFQWLFKERFELLGIKQEIQELRKGL